MLFRLKDVTLDRSNAPEWADLFVKCVGNHLMAHATYQPLARDEQASLDAYVADTHINLWQFARRAFMAPAFLRKAFGGPGLSSAEMARIIDLRMPDSVVASEADAYDDAAEAADLAITPAEKAWLASRINGDGATDALEVALLDFIKRESGPVSL